MATPTLNSLDDLLLYELQDLYSAEQQLTKALPKMKDAATSSDLKSAFEEHLDETRNQVQRLEQAFDHLGKRTKAEHCEAMEGLLKEGQEVMGLNGDPAVKDAALISAAQRVEHYEMAGYGSAHAYAKQLGHSDVASLLKKTLNEEESADKKLNKIAQGGLLSSGINKEARKA